MSLETPTSPVACTLEPSKLATRLSEWASLNTVALRQARRLGPELELVYAPDARDRVRKLVQSERECCQFLRLELCETADEVRLTIRVPESAGISADLVFAAFSAKAPMQARRFVCCG